MALGVEFEAQIKELRIAYVASLRQQVMQFEAALVRLAEAREPSAEERERARLREIAHKLGGSGALYGLNALTAWGKSVEKLARRGTLVELGLAAQRFDALVAELGT